VGEQWNRDVEERRVGKHRGKGPQGFQRSDERIRELVCEVLEDDDDVDATTIAVEVKGGEVTLTGTVEDRPTKRRVEDCVERVRGVRDIQNLLRVYDPARVRPPSSSGVPTRNETAQPIETDRTGPRSKA
jgi:osmotically-inducible protein OsmY